MKKYLAIICLTMLIAAGPLWAGPKITSLPSWGTATTGVPGAVELATDAETVTGTSDAVVTTPGNITAKMAAPGAIGGTTPAAGTFTNLNADEGKFGATTRVTINDGANEDGITFGSLGTATKGIDFNASGLTGATDYPYYFNSSNYWTASGNLRATNFLVGNLYDAGNTRSILSGVTTAQNDVILNSDVAYNNTITAISTLGNALVGNKTPVGIWAGDGVSNGTTTITDVGGAAHGLSLAAGDMVHIQNSTTAADEGVYRVVSDDGTSVVVDRALSGSNTNLSVTFYKDVIGVFGTDGTNGQRIMNYSHQDKPLQIGGDVLDATANMGAEDVLIGNVLGFVNRDTEPGGALTNGIIIYAEDSTDTTSSLSLRLEQAVEDIGTFTESHKIKVQINGTWYWIQLDAV